MPSLVARVFCAAAALGALGVAARPSASAPGLMDLAAVLNRTTCPIVVDYDVDEKRIPMRIKVLKCGGDPMEHCRARGVPEYECCGVRGRDDVRMECAEVRDQVLVFFPEQAPGAQEQPYPISVGCACVVHSVPQVDELSPA